MSRAPGWLLPFAALGLALLVLPLLALLVRLDWSSVPAVLASTEAQQALGLSLATAACATLICLVFGVPLALVLARAGQRTAAVLRVLISLPLVMPPLVGGIALLALLGRTGVFGSALALAGIRIPFTTAAVVIAQAFVALPFLVITLEGSLRTSGTRFEQVAASLGASRSHVLWRITLPLVMPGLVSGTVLCFARALGEFGATALFAGNAPGVTRTIPLAIYSAFNGAGVNENLAITLALLLIAVALAVLLGLRSWRPEVER
ncbi:MAG TPA: ABC transporter permease [Candidatus Lumbricidophila sp.]|nr:ABC transporter permease [Candidatus Lumbricidophila sp.]